MFKKRFRLHTSEFKEVFNFGKTIKTPFFLIKIKKNTLSYPRFAVSVSKKISKKAVERNYLKRRFVCALKEGFDQVSPFDYVFILNSEIKDIQYKDLIIQLKNITL